MVVNDLGAGLTGEGADRLPADDVVEEIVERGGRAVASPHDVSNWAQAKELVDLAIDTFGGLHVLVNNAGILRDRTLANLEESDWDAVIAVHLKGHAAPTRHAMSYWRSQSKAGTPVAASVVHTTSVAGFCGNFGQANYSAAKAAVLGLSKVVALEGKPYGVRSNAVSPSARTRITLAIPGSEERLREPESPGAFDHYSPANVSPLVAWLAEEGCQANDQVFHVSGNRIFVLEVPRLVTTLETTGRWTPDALDRELPAHLVEPLPLATFF